MSGYYDPFPRMSLTRPILIGGQIGSGTRLIGRSFCARTGLPFVDIDRKIEHQAGSGLAQIAAEEGPQRVERWADSMLDRYVRQRPWSVIVMDRAWPRKDLRRQLAERVDFVHVLRAGDYLLERMHEDLSGPAFWLLRSEPEVMRDPDRWPELLEDCLARRAPLLESARILFDAGELHPHRVAELLIESLDAVVEAREVESVR